MCCPLSSACASVCVCVCTSVMCCNGVVGERHTDSEDPSWWQRQPLPPDEQRSDWWEWDTISLFLSVFSCSFLLYHSPSPFILHLIQFLPLTPIPILQGAVSPSFPPPPHPTPLSLVIPLLLFLVVRCSFTLHFSLPLSISSHFTHLPSLPVSTRFYTIGVMIQNLKKRKQMASTLRHYTYYTTLHTVYTMLHTVQQHYLAAGNTTMK